jgi:hypothetical protein
MAIDQSKITSQLTLEIDEEDIPLPEFIKALENFSKLVRAVSKVVSPNKDAGAWTVRVYEGSAGIGLSGRAGVFTSNEVNAIRTNVLSGLRDLENGVRPQNFSDPAIEASRQLSTLFRTKTAPGKVRVWSGNESAYKLPKTIADAASTLLDAEYESNGTVDGRLERLNSHNGLDFEIFSIINARSVKCEVSEALADIAHRNWRKRVEVVGTVRYRKDGVPVSVKATEIIEYPDPKSLPSLDELRAVLLGA